MPLALCYSEINHTMEVKCATCHRKIDSENINVAKDIAYCTTCENLTVLSDLIGSTPSKNFDPHSPVNGVTVKDSAFNWMIIASHRSWTSLFIVPFTMVWAGGSLGGIYGSQLLEGEFDLFRSLFGIPFLIGSVALITLSLMTLFGRTLVSVENRKALVFIGIGSIGWYRRFDWSSVDRVNINTSDQHEFISLEGAKKINFGWGLNSEKVYFIGNYLRQKLKK